jgi:hypothetical protein
MCAPSLAGQRLLVDAPRDGDGAKSHFCGELHTEMAKATDVEDRHEIARPGDRFRAGRYRW